MCKDVATAPPLRAAARAVAEISLRLDWNHARRWFTIAIAVALCIGAASTALAQRRRGFGFGAPLRMATPESFDGGFNFCRIMFSQSPDGDGGNWSVDYPRADVNLSIRLSELTRTRISRDAVGRAESRAAAAHRRPDVPVPLHHDDRSGRRLLQPGGSRAAARVPAQRAASCGPTISGADCAWEVWAREIGKALPPSEYPIVDLPLTHPIFHQQFDLKRVIQIPSIGLWQSASAAAPPNAAPTAPIPHARAIFDKHGRMMVFITHNTDFGDAFEQEAADPRYFYTFSVDGYAVGINVLLYALTH